jgi:hypothetical protein
MTQARVWIVAAVVVGLVGSMVLSSSWGKDEEAAVTDLGAKGVKRVDCDKRHMLTTALPWAERSDSLHVTGTCQEQVTITTDRLTPNGDGSAVLDGGGTQPLIPFHGVITVDAAHGIGVTGFTIQNGPNGIVAMKGAAIAVIKVTAQDNVQGIIVMTTPRPSSQTTHHSTTSLV